MHNYTFEETDRNCGFAPGLWGIITAAEAAGWSVRRAESFVELFKPNVQPAKPVGYQINSKWWCRDVLGARELGKSYRVTAPTLRELLGLSMQAQSAHPPQGQI
jgi:hypothetical protein